MIIGIDLGNFGVNTSENDFFYSRISDISNFSEENKINYEGTDLYIGDGEFSTDWNKSQKESTLSLLFQHLLEALKKIYFK